MIKHYDPNREALSAALRNDLLSFFERMFREVSGGRELEVNWHHEAIAHVLEECGAGRIDQLLINIQPRSLKTLFVSVGWVAFMLGRDPTLRFLCVSYADNLAEDFSRLCRQVMQAAWYRELFPETRLSRETAHELHTSRGGYRKAISMAGVLTGRGGDIIIIDDPMKPEDAASETGRAAAKRYFAETLASRFDNQAKSRFVIVMQRLHQDDLAGLVLEEGGWHHLCLPAIATVEEDVPLGGGRFHKRCKGELLHPAREPPRILDRARARLGSTGFQAQYQQDPTPAEGNIIKRQWVRRYDSPLPFSEGRYTQSWDTAMKGDPACAYSCCTTWVEHEGRHYLVHVYRGKLDFPDLRKKTLELYDRFRPTGVLVESKGSGQSLAQELRAMQRGIPVIERNPTPDKEARLASVAPLLEAGLVYLPHDAEWLHEYEKELLGFPSTKNDDQVDSSSQYLSWSNERRNQRFEWDFGHEDQVPTPDHVLSWRRFI